MAQDILKEFLVAIGFDVDSAGQAKVTSTVQKTEDQLTKTVEAGADARVEAEQQAFSKRVSIAQALRDLVKIEEQKLADARTAIAKKDADQQERIERDKAKKSTERRENAFKEASSSLLKLSALVAKFALGFEATSLAGIVYGLNKAAAGFERLFYQSRLLGASAGNIQAFSYAAEQLGASTESVQQSYGKFGENLRLFGSGYENNLKALGVRTREANGQFRDTAEILTDLGDRLRDIGKRQGYTQAIVQAGAFGLDEMTTRAIMDPQFRAREDEQRRVNARIGANPNEASEEGRKFEQSMRGLETRVGAIQTRLTDQLFKTLQPSLDKLSNWMDQHGAKVADTLARIAEDIIKLAKAIVETLGKVPWEKILGEFESFAKQFNDITEKFFGTDGFTLLAFVAFGGMLTRVVLTPLKHILAALRLLVAVPMPAWLLAALGLGAVKLAQGAVDFAVDKDEEKRGVADMQRKMQENPEKYGISNNPIARAWRWTKKKLGFGGDEGEEKPHPLNGIEGLRARGTEAARKRKDKNASLAGSTFDQKAPGVMRRLKADFNLTDEEAAAVVGNLGHESAGFRAYNEGGGGPGRGWAQWTDPGRKARFFAYAQGKLDPNQTQNLDPRSDEANYGFLKWELSHTHKGAISALKNADGLEGKTVAFEGAYEGAGVKAYRSRYGYALRALKAHKEAEALPAITPPMVRPRYGSHRGAPTPMPPMVGGVPGVQFAPTGSPFGTLDADAIRHAMAQDNRPPWLRDTKPISPLVTLHRPLGDTPALHQSIDNSHTKGDTTLNHSPVFNISGGDVRQNMEVARQTASRGSRDLLLNMRGAEY